MLLKTKLTCSSYLFLIFILSSCDKLAEQKPQDYPYNAVGMTMGTSYNIKASKLPDSLTPTEITRQVKALLEKVNGQMSTYQKDSELSLFNQNTSTDWIPVSPELHEVLKEALKISQLANGVFDVTVGPLVNVWGFGPDEMSLSPPDDAVIKDKLNQIGYQHLKLKDDGLFVKKDIPRLYVDLSGIAKGYGVDQVASLLERLGLVDYMVEIGGEIRVKGKNNQGQSWQIAVEKPTAEKRAIEKVLAITDTGVATSGDYRNYFEVEGVRFSHTIDPRTGRPINHKLASITILSETSMEADGLATAIMVLGPDEGFQFAEKNHIAAFFIIKSDKGFDEKMSTAFAQSTKVSK
ncbi:FAD:protein FMN transferase [Methyloglobulus sp.]|uniref:FAD:protein FMN transferase n=1 Tax=Methyloglobulus sp. TaxID=2518622 RepID=UPI0032B71085